MQENGAHVVEVALEPVGGVSAHGDEAGAGVFATTHGDEVFGKVEVVHGEGDQFAEAQAGGVERFEDGAVAKA